MLFSKYFSICITWLWDDYNSLTCSTYSSACCFLSSCLSKQIFSVACFCLFSSALLSYSSEFSKASSIPAAYFLVPHTSSIYSSKPGDESYLFSISISFDFGGISEIFLTSNWSIKNLLVLISILCNSKSFSMFSFLILIPLW